MDPAQRHAWLRDHPPLTFKHSKLMNTETRCLTRTQRSRLERRKKPKLFDIKTPDIKNSEPSPTPHESPHKRDYEDEIQIDQPTSKQPRQLSPSLNPSSSQEPQQPQSPPSNDEDSDPPPILTNDGKRRRQEDDTRQQETKTPRECNSTYHN